MYKIPEVHVFENYDIRNIDRGRVELSTKVVDNSLNSYGNAHGGYLFTLCDQVSGLVCLSMGVNAVTMQSNMHFMQAGHRGDTLIVNGICQHDGKTSKVVDVTIVNKSGEKLSQATFTMYVT